MAATSAPPDHAKAPSRTESSSTCSSSTTNFTTILHPHIIHANILTRLDGATLASAASVSSLMRHLCTEEDLWRNICTATWPSLLDPTSRRVISTFPNGHRSVFSDAFPSLHPSSPRRLCPSPPPPELISAVDIFYEGKPVFSRAKRTEMQKNWFLTSPLWIEALDPNELVRMPVKFVRKEKEMLKQLEENLSVSWIVMDPVRKRAANVSSRRAVSVVRHWMTREVEAVYAAEMTGERGRATERVQCAVKVTCNGKVGGELHVRAVNLVMEDMEGVHVRGAEALMILGNAMDCGERKRVESVGVIAKERFEIFSRLMKVTREKKLKREKARKIVSMLMVIVAIILFCFITGF